MFDRTFTLSELINHPATAMASAAVSPAVDIYGIGLLCLVLATEKVPFSNVGFDEAVHAELLGNRTPTIPAVFPEREELLPLVQRCAAPCLQCAASMRPDIADVRDTVEEVFCDMEYGKLTTQLQQRSAEIDRVQTEVRELTATIKKQILLISKGSDLLKKREVSWRAYLPTSPSLRFSVSIYCKQRELLPI